MRKSERIELRATPAFVARLDQARGDVPRTKFIERAVEAALGASPGGIGNGSEVGPSPSPASPPEPSRESRHG